MVRRVDVRRDNGLEVPLQQLGEERDPKQAGKAATEAGQKRHLWGGSGGREAHVRASSSNLQRHTPQAVAASHLKVNHVVLQQRNEEVIFAHDQAHHFQVRHFLLLVNDAMDHLALLEMLDDLAPLQEEMERCVCTVMNKWP